MAAGDIITLAEFKSFLGKEARDRSDKDPELEMFRKSAEEMIRRECELNFDQRVYAGELHSGGSAQVHILANQPPVAATPLPTVTENGVALTAAAGDWRAALAEARAVLKGRVVDGE